MAMNSTSYRTFKRPNMNLGLTQCTSRHTWVSRESLVGRDDVERDIYCDISRRVMGQASAQYLLQRTKHETIIFSKLFSSTCLDRRKLPFIRPSSLNSICWNTKQRIKKFETPIQPSVMVQWTGQLCYPRNLITSQRVSLLC